MSWGVAFLLWIACGLIGAAILSRTNRAGTGCLLGFLLGPIGVLIALLMKDSGRVECPHCRSLVDRRATICPHCRSSLTPSVVDPMPDATQPPADWGPKIPLAVSPPSDPASPRGLSAGAAVVFVIVVLFAVFALAGALTRR